MTAVQNLCMVLNKVDMTEFKFALPSYPFPLFFPLPRLLCYTVELDEGTH